MTNAYVKIYPVLNGTCILVHTEDDQFILIDCKITRDSEDPNNQVFFDVKDDLISILPTNSYGAPYVDLFVLSHPDQDHCHGFENHFYTGKPSNYTKTDKEGHRIMINEIWTSKIIYGEVCKDAECIRTEVSRRRDLYTSSDHRIGTDYNRLSMVGYDDDQEFTDCPSYYPSDLVSYVAGKQTSYLSVFIHGPFKKSLIDSSATGDRNLASVIAQYQLTSPDHNEKLLLLEGGDADHYQWAMVKEKTEEHSREEYLYFDVFLAAHHCSWSFYNNRPYNENKDPAVSSRDLVSIYGKPNCLLVSSSKEIIDDENNPPHYPAKQQYAKDLIASGKFLCTGETPNRAEPKPIIIELTNTGAVQGNNLPDKKKISKAEKGEKQFAYLASNPGTRAFGCE